MTLSLRMAMNVSYRVNYNTIQAAGWTGPTVILYQQGWRLQSQEPAAQTTFDRLLSLWWHEDDSTKSLYRPTVQ